MVAAGVMQGKSMSRALRDAGLAPDSGNYGPGQPGRIAVDSAIVRALKRKGVNMSLLAQRHREGLDAVVTKHFPTLAYEDPNEGVVIPEKTLVDFKERRENVELGYKVFGAIPTEPMEQKGGQGPILGILFFEKSTDAAGQTQEKQVTGVLDFRERGKGDGGNE